MNLTPFHIEQHEAEGRIILSLSGELDLSVIPQLGAALEPVVDRTDRGLELNLKNLTYIDSTGIGVIVSVLKIRHALKAPFVVREIPPGIQRLFDMTGISSHLSEGIEN